MLTICSKNSLEIANGEISGDRLGHFTCLNNRGTFVVDHLVLSRSLVKTVIYFKVLPPKFDSKHAPVTDTFKSCFVKVGKGMTRVLSYFNPY